MDIWEYHIPRMDHDYKKELDLHQARKARMDGSIATSDDMSHSAK